MGVVRWEEGFEQYLERSKRESDTVIEGSE
jgi:hypothetical protein